jgi:hypothetical protein
VVFELIRRKGRKSGEEEKKVRPSIDGDAIILGVKTRHSGRGDWRWGAGGLSAEGREGGGGREREREREREGGKGGAAPAN